MLRNLSFTLVTLSVVSVMFVSGCGPSATNLGLKFSPNESASYKATSEVVKDFRFDQPNLDKLREEQTKSLIEMAFTQTIDSVDADGTATAKITIDKLVVDLVSKNEPTFSFNSEDEKDKNNPLSKLLGKSYSIKISPTGEAVMLDTKEAMASVTSPYEKKIAKSILDPKAIADRHTITALPKEQAGSISVKKSWSEMVPSPPGLLAPKTYEKTYTLSSIDNNVATVKMEATESGQAAEGQSQSGGSMGFFAKMFDNKDKYTGVMKMDMVSGQVLEQDETLISSYVAEEMPEKGDPEKGPDTLTMQFTNRLHLERLN